MSTLPDPTVLITDELDGSLVLRARKGDRESMDALIRQIQGRLHCYVYRCTLDVDESQDIVQEALLEMVRLLDRLGDADRFWPWLRAIAYNKIRNRRRKEKLRRAVSLSQIGEDCVCARNPGKNYEGLSHVMGQEVQQIIWQAIREIRPQYRDILSMRCYENMEYAQIASLMGRSTFGTRMLFVRAKRALAGQLARHGFAKVSLLTALVMFGKMTAPSEAAAAQISVTAASIKVGAGAALVGTATTATGAAAAVLTIGAVVSVITLAAGFGHETSPFPQSQSVVTRHFQTVVTKPAAERTNELWYYFPDGPGGAVMMRLARGRSVAGRAGYHWLQNHAANYFYNSRDNTIYIHNFRTWQHDLRVRELPTDGLSLREFLARVQDPAESQVVPVTEEEGKGLLIVADRDNADVTNYGVQPETPYNILAEESFQYNWPPDAQVVDMRDPMHQRGWTWFTIGGHIHGHRVQGAGQIPFVHLASAQVPAWLRLEIGDRVEVVDCPSGTTIRRANGKQIAFAAGSLFEAFSRPWMGLHSIDTVRRDAAQRGIWFETEYSPPDLHAKVELHGRSGNIIYKINMERDLVEEMSFFCGTAGKQQIGYLQFVYMQDLPPNEAEFTQPRFDGPISDRPPDHLWWLDLPAWVDGRQVADTRAP